MTDSCRQGATREAVLAATHGVEKLRDLHRSSTEIGDVLRLITGVPERTRASISSGARSTADQGASAAQIIGETTQKAAAMHSIVLGS